MVVTIHLYKIFHKIKNMLILHYELLFLYGHLRYNIPIPGIDNDEKLFEIDIEEFLSNDFEQIFSTQYSIPIYLDAEATIIEDFGKDTIESMISQTTNWFSQIAREIQFKIRNLINL